MNPPFPPPPGAFFPNMPPLPLINMPAQFHIPPMGGIIPIPVGIPSPQVAASMGITVPTGVTTISAPPVRKITPNVNPQNPTPIHHLPQVIKPTFLNQKPKSTYNGPIITVFVGNINEKASDLVIRQLLDKCGNVTNWKRVKGPNNKFQAFGYCDYAEADSANRAIRLLHDFEIGDKKLVVKVDAKTKEKLDAYAKEKNSKLANSNSLDEETAKEDKIVLNSIMEILNENKNDLLNKSEEPEETNNKFEILTNVKTPAQNQKSFQNFSDMDIEEEKKSLIHREIGKFRDTYKKQDEEKEKREAEKLKERESRKENDKDRISKDRERDRRDRDKERNRTPVRDTFSRKSDRYDRNDRHDRNDRETSRNFDDEEFNERRRLERELRKKEQSYQARLKNWESREMRKQRQYEKEKYKNEARKEYEEKEILKLKQFLEDYNDDIDDNTYYRGSALSKKQREREKEIEEDERDRNLEKKELEDLRKKLAEEGHPDPESEAKKLLNNKPNNNLIKNDNNYIYKNNINSNINNSPRNEEIHVKSFTLTKQDNHRHLNMVKNSSSNEVVTDSNITPVSDFQNNNTSSYDKKKKLSIHDVFNSNEDDDKSLFNKKRKLPVFIDENTDSNQSLSGSIQKSLDSKLLSSEDKRKQIKALIDNIPTTKEKLFKYEIDWDVVDSTLMEKRIRPWINKKITEYIGEEEKSLLDFICGKLNARCDAQSILDDVAMVLDEEAEVFIVKMLRLLIYEIEAKKLGLGK